MDPWFPSITFDRSFLATSSALRLLSTKLSTISLKHSTPYLSIFLNFILYISILLQRLSWISVISRASANIIESKYFNLFSLSQVTGVSLNKRSFGLLVVCSHFCVLGFRWTRLVPVGSTAPFPEGWYQKCVPVLFLVIDHPRFLGLFTVIWGNPNIRTTRYHFRQVLGKIHISTAFSTSPDWCPQTIYDIILGSRSTRRENLRLNNT
jgi:hypothetical protein